MKKKYLFLTFVVLFIAAVAGVIIKYNINKAEEEGKVYRLLDRTGPDANTTEWINMKKRGDALVASLEANPSDIKSALKLASLFIQEARITGNNLYYDMAAMKTVNAVLKIDSANFEALVYKSLIYLSQHHFADGLATAQKAQQINPYNAYVYGLMIDGNVEMGNYDSAIANADRMVAIRPDLTSYSRISYVREIYGDYKGAIEAMKMAVEAGGPGDEYTEWSRVQLAMLLEKTGDYKNAETLYNNSLSYRPNYPFALAGLGRVAMASGDYKKSVAFFEKADSMISDFTIKEQLSEAYKMEGQANKAEDLAYRVIDELSKNAEAGNTDENIGHYADRELAYAYLKVNEKDKALDHALLEYNRRPANIDVNETLAWVYYSRGEYAKALPYIKIALKTNSKNPVLLNRAALIFYKSGDKPMAKSMLASTSQANPCIDYSLKAEATAIMQNL